MRYAIPSAQLVVLPYNTLLHTPTREAVGVKLRGNIVVIDEAHNLLDTISSVYSVEITGAHVSIPTCRCVNQRIHLCFFLLI